MGSVIQNYQINKSTCLDVVKEARLRERQSPGPAVLDSSFQLDVSTVCSARVTMPSVSVLEDLSIWLLSWSTWQLRSLSWLAMLPVTTRRAGSFPVIFSWLSVMTRSSTNSLLELPSHRVEFFLTSRLFSCQRNHQRRLLLKIKKIPQKRRYD